MPVASRRRAVLATLVVGAALTLAGPTPAFAASPDVVISQVYGGGGNAGATYTNDFIELYNRGTTTVSLAGWSVQYAASAGTSYSVTALTGSLAPGKHYLVGEGAGAGGTTALPTPDATGTASMAATSGKVAVVTSTAALGCGTACAAAAGVRDFVGYGAAADHEGATAAPTLSNTSSGMRLGGGTTDTDVNGNDFIATAPTPRNTADTGGISGLRIHDIQGAAKQSPYAAKQVAAVAGVVTAAGTNGFWMQDTQPDADPATSEGIFVFTSVAPTVAVGDAATVSGTVTEFRAGGASSGNLTTTEISGGPSVTKTGTASLPVPTLVGPGGRVPPGEVIEDDASTGNVEGPQTFDPASDGIDFWESMEGMRVEMDDAQVVGPSNSFGDTPVVPVGSGVRTTRGGIAARAGDFNPERVVVSDTLAAVPTVNVGDSFAGATVGVLDYSFGNFTLLPTTSPTPRSGGLQREVTRAATAGELAVATFNVQNLAPTDPQAKFDTLAQYAVHNLAAPDVLALEEIQDNSGATDDGTVAADQTLGKLISAISAAGGPAYSYREIDPVNDADGGQPGGNIRVAFLFRTDRGLSFVDRPGGTSTAATTVTTDAAGRPHLSFSPGRIAPTDAAWNASRKPLAGEFTWHGHTVFVIANHFVSKGGDDPLFGRAQPPQAPSETRRHQQATLVRGFVDGIVAADPAAAVVVVGDLNDYDFSQTADILVGNGSLTDLPRTLPVAERYTYDFEGNSEVLDHILLSSGLAGAGAYDYDVVHVNSEFADQASDHEPQVVRLALG